MTDKIQKIKDWISKTQDGLMNAQGNFENPSEEGAFHILSNLDYYIDSLQEEPISEMWHDANEEQPEEYRTVVVWNPIIMDGEVLTRCAEVYKGRIWAYIEDLLRLSNVERTVKNLKEKHVSEGLEEAADEYAPDFSNSIASKAAVDAVRDAFKAGAKWQKEKEYTCYEEVFEDDAKWKVENLWKPADGKGLPEYEREVIVLTQPYPLEGLEYAVSFAHRPNPNGWDGKSITTGKVEHYTPKTYDEGGWNIPNVKYWLDCSLPNLKED